MASGDSKPLEAILDHFSKKNSGSFKHTISEDCSDSNAVRRKRLCALDTDRRGLARPKTGQRNPSDELEGEDPAILSYGTGSVDQSNSHLESTTRRLEALSKSRIQHKSLGFNPNGTQTLSRTGLEDLEPLKEPEQMKLPQLSSGSWSKNDDNTLVALRAMGRSWSQILREAFPGKTANACRKRHQRLTEYRRQKDLESRRLERVSMEYMNMRKEIWQRLAARVGEKWHVVEAQCMSNGLKDIQAHASSYTRRQRLEAASQDSDGLTVASFDSDWEDR